MAEDSKILIPDSVKEKWDEKETQLRISALDFAIKAGGPISNEDIVKRASAFYDFLKGAE